MRNEVIDLANGTDCGAGCLDLPGPRLQLRHALAYMAVLLFVLGRLATLRLPALTTFLRPSQTGGPGGGPMCWTTARAGGDAGCAPEGPGTCLDLPAVPVVRPLRFPILVIVERVLAAGWTLRRGVVMGSG